MVTQQNHTMPRFFISLEKVLPVKTGEWFIFPMRIYEKIYSASCDISVHGFQLCVCPSR